jgi:hypothetical protein
MEQSDEREQLFVVFDSHGPYEFWVDERKAMEFCDRYNQRANDPLKPYTYRRYVPALRDGTT